MGEKDIRIELDSSDLRVFTQGLLRELRALDHLLHQGLIESGVRRIGLEQELFLVDDQWRPAPVAVQALERIKDPRVTTEIGRFNLEFNLEPLLFGGNCLRLMENRLNELLDKVRRTVRDLGAEVVLTGILPTIRKSDLTLDNMVPSERYYALNDALTRQRGGSYDLRIKGTDELRVTHDSVMLEAANASFQVHFQVGPDEFARLYNIAMAVTAPVLAAAVNSPLMLGRRLWSETRIAVFQQSVDTRSAISEVRDIPARVSFGREWVDESVIEIFKSDVSRFRVLLGREIDEDPFEAIEEGRVPTLKALQLFNSTVYRWNRACYGVAGGVAHLRIENRVLPSGPSLRDEVANAAFWFGLLSGVAEEVDDIRKAIAFDTVFTNFLAAARHGLDAHMTWLDGETVTAQKLICDTLLPLARRGLQVRGIDAADIERYLDTVEARVDSRRTGAQWYLSSLAGMGEKGTLEERMAALVAATVERQRHSRPVHEWDRAELSEAGSWKPSYLRVEQYMSTDLLTVNEEEAIDLVANLMDWHRIHHVPVEDNEHRLVGLMSHRPLLRFLASDEARQADGPIPVSSVMVTDLVTAGPETTTLEAIELMRERRISCLPIVKDGRLIGIITERDFMRIAGTLLEEMLRD
ncbi:MAG: glutamate-cysteine ligase family protein [Candidatus Palauibacterales bacterium]|nr:glutamate-cysteine ligase family protein [Candidatus Palauibacterales bacterium]MDP2482779.1 glutamate-cysteine ligase family protein [Candidatus Palauibacterales bacterium]